MVNKYNDFLERIGHVDKSNMSKKEKEFDKHLIKKVSRYRKDRIFDFTIKEIEHGIKYGYRAFFERYFCDYLSNINNEILGNEYDNILKELSLENNLENFLKLKKNED